MDFVYTYTLVNQYIRVYNFVKSSYNGVMYIKLSMLPLLRRPRERKIGRFEAKAQNARDISDAWARLASHVLL